MSETVKDLRLQLYRLQHVADGWAEEVQRLHRELWDRERELRELRDRIDAEAGTV